MVGTIIVIIDQIFPNFIFTTILDVEFDTMTQKSYNERKHKILGRRRDSEADEDVTVPNHDKTMALQSRPKLPPFMRGAKRKSKEKKHSNDRHSTVESAPNKKTIGSALGVKLNPAYLSDKSSENNTINRYDSSMKQDHSISLATRDELSQREKKLDASDKSMREKRVNISDDQTIKL